MEYVNEIDRAIMNDTIPASVIDRMVRKGMQPAAIIERWNGELDQHDCHISPDDGCDCGSTIGFAEEHIH